MLHHLCAVLLRLQVHANNIYYEFVYNIIFSVVHTLYLFAGLATIDADAAKASRAKPRLKADTDLCNCKAQLFAECLCGTDCWSVLRRSSFDAARVMLDMRLQLQSVKRQEQSRELFNMLLPMRRIKQTGKKRFYIDFCIHGQPVCGNVWCEFLGLRYEDSRMKKVLAALRRGDSEWVVDASTANQQGRRGMWAEAWMRDFVRETADWHPEDSTALLDPNPVEVKNHHKPNS